MVGGDLSTDATGKLAPRRERRRNLPGDFIQHYVLPVLYPGELTRGVQIGLGALAIVINAVVYWYVWKRTRTED